MAGALYRVKARKSNAATAPRPARGFAGRNVIIRVGKVTPFALYIQTRRPMKHVKKPYPVLVLLVLAALLLAACGGTPTAPAVPTAAPGQATPEAQSAEPTQPAPAA